MRITLYVDDALLKRAQEVTGIGAQLTNRARGWEETSGTWRFAA